MSLLDTLLAEADRFDSGEHLDAHLSATADLIEQLEQLLDDDDLEQDVILFNTKKYKEEWESKLRKNLKSANSNVNKLQRNALDKIEPLVDDVYLYKVPKTPQTTKWIDNAIRLHLLREGDLGIDVGRSDLMSKFQEKNRIMTRLQRGDLSSVAEWVADNAPGTELEFMVHKLQFLTFYKDGNPLDAYRYAQKWFPRLLSNSDDVNLSDASKLMTCLLFPPNDPTSPYLQLTNSTDLSELANLFSKQFCSTIGFSFESTLCTVILAAYIALPYFDKFQKIRQLTNLDWTSKDELPFEVHLPEFLKFHAIYICPVAKCETTSENPAMALPCHHLISMQAMWKLSKNGSSFKCPYCPATALPTQCRQVQFHII